MDIKNSKNSPSKGTTKLNHKWIRPFQGFFIKEDGPFSLTIRYTAYGSHFFIDTGDVNITEGDALTLKDAQNACEFLKTLYSSSTLKEASEYNIYDSLIIDG